MVDDLIDGEEVAGAGGVGNGEGFGARDLMKEYGADGAAGAEDVVKADSFCVCGGRRWRG